MITKKARLNVGDPVMICITCCFVLLYIVLLYDVFFDENENQQKKDVCRKGIWEQRKCDELHKEKIGFLRRRGNLSL